MYVYYIYLAMSKIPKATPKIV